MRSMTAPFRHSVQRVTIAELKRLVPLAEMIATLGLKHRGRSLQCPNAGAHKHGDRNPSASISKSGWSWHCHTCKAGGTVFDLVMVARGCSQQEAYIALADYAGIAISPAELGQLSGQPPTPPIETPTPAPPEPPKPATKDIQDFLIDSQRRLLNGDHAKGYLQKRGIPFELARDTGLGFAPRGTWPHRRGQGQPRIVAPLTTPDGTLLTLYGRSTVMCEKSLRHDFLPGAKGVFHAQSLKEDWVVLTEGVFDTLACLTAGRPSTALCGLTTRENWWQAIAANNIIIALDADEAADYRRETIVQEAKQWKTRILLLKGESLHPHKDLNEYWVQEKRLPHALIEPTAITGASQP